MEESFYDILGLTDEERSLIGEEFNEACKKKYRALAIKYHPDKWASKSEEERKAAEEKFKAVSEAYNTLTDEKKRAQYDWQQSGSAYNGGFDGTDIGFHGIDMDEIFRRATGEGPFGGRAPFKGDDLNADLTMTLSEAYTGGEHEITINRPVECHHCHGTGSDDGNETKCPHCHGTGWFERRQSMGPNQMSVMRGMCPHCHGTGKIVTNPCHVCGGTGVEYETVTETFDIPAGLPDGVVLKTEGMGSPSENGGPNGDLYIHIHIVKDPYFDLDGSSNVIHYEEIPFNEAMVGFKRDVKCVDGSTLTIHGSELTKDEKVFMFRGKGMPVPNTVGVRGDYAVVVKYKMPDKLTDGQREMLRKFNEL